MAAVKTTVIGSYLSPYVRKVLVCLDLKGIAYEIDPIAPFYGNDEFAHMTLTDSRPRIAGLESISK